MEKIDSIPIINRILSHFRRDLHKVLDDIDIRLALFKRKLILYERRDEMAMVEKAQKYCEANKVEQLHGQIDDLLTFYGVKNAKIHLSHQFPLEFEPYLHHLYTLQEELSIYSVNSMVKKSENKIEAAFNELKKDLQQARGIQDGDTLIGMINPLLQELTQFEDFLLEETFSRQDESRIIQQCVALSQKIDTLERLITHYYPALDEHRQNIIIHWNQIVEALIHAFDKVYAGKTVPMTMRSGVQEFAVEGV
ncbi:MAG: hypothetical protein Q7K45_04815 [Nanoarchaeota archaeon]|nr:hypothetical protein [Nanoarchaeota archaeon]